MSMLNNDSRLLSVKYFLAFQCVVACELKVVVVNCFACVGRYTWGLFSEFYGIWLQTMNYVFYYPPHLDEIFYQKLSCHFVAES